MSFLRHLRHKRVRRPVQSALETTGAIPSSGLDSLENSQGASQAVAEFSKELDIAIEHIDLGQNLNEQLRHQLNRLDEGASLFANSSLAGFPGTQEWSCSQAEGNVISVAWKSALAAYEEEIEPALPGFIFKSHDYIPASTNGLTKRTLFLLVEPTSNTASDSLFPCLIIAVRGTSNNIDGIVNIHGNAKEASSFFEIETPDPELAEELSNVKAHAGFLNSAKSLIPAVSENIEELVHLQKIKHVVFTGHSAGGSTASLLCLRYLLGGARKYPSLTFSCITFGSPPVIFPQLPVHIYESQQTGMLIDITNEYDLVSRVDRAYIYSLIDLYRSISNSQPNQNPTGASTSTTVEHFTPPKGEDKRWPLPEPEFWHIGTRVVLKLSLSSIDDPEKLEDIDLSAYVVEPTDFAKLLFCRITVHSRIYYDERINLIARGQFNGHASWGSHSTASTCNLSEQAQR